jgi:hypothetical protein
MFYASAHRALQEQQLYPYHIEIMQETLWHDASARRAVCQGILYQTFEASVFRQSFIHKRIVLQ